MSNARGLPGGMGTLGFDSYIIDKYVGSFLKSPPIECREIDWTNGLTSLSMGDVAKEGHSKFNPRHGSQRSNQLR